MTKGIKIHSTSQATTVALRVVISKKTMKK